MKRLFLLTALLLCLSVFVSCGEKTPSTIETAPEKHETEEPIETASPVRLPELNDGKLVLERHIHYETALTVSENDEHYIFTTYAELEKLVNEGGFVKNISVGDSKTFGELLKYCTEADFKDYNLALFIPKKGDLKYDGYVDSVSVGEDRLEVRLEYWEAVPNKLKEDYSICLALKLPKEYCTENTVIDFVFGERAVLPESAPYIEDETEPETSKSGENVIHDTPKIPLGQKVTSFEDLDKLDLTNDRIERVKAFLTNDVKKLEELCYYEEGVYSGLSGIEIESFEVWAEESQNSIDNDVFMNVNISSVGNEHATTLTVGNHILKIGDHRGCFEEVDRKSGNNNTPKTETEKFISAWFATNGYKFDREYNTGYTESYVWFVHIYYQSLFGEGGTKAEYEKYFKTLYGRDATFELDAHLTFENGGKAEIKYPHGGFGYWFDFVESGEDYVVVQFYADHGYLTHGPRVKYTFTRADGILVPACYEYLSFSDKFPAGYAA